MKTLLKNELKDGRYYSGYINQKFCILTDNAAKIVGMWDAKDNCFIFWEFEGNIKSKSKLTYLPDIDNELESGFFPIKEIIPKDDFIIE